MRTLLIDEEEFEVAIDEGSRYGPVYVRESDEGYHARVVRDPAATASWTRAQAVNGFIEAQVGWGHLLLAGHGVERDPAAALRWFRIAARGGNADAINMIGRCYEYGWSVPSDTAMAALWYRMAADKGHAWAEFNLASLLAQGNGVAQDIQEALALLVRSARRGNAKAMNMLGRHREDNYDGRKNGSVALWYRWAAQRGCFRGQYHHARLLLGAGKTDEAARWFNASLSQAPRDFRLEAARALCALSVQEIREIGSKALESDGEPAA